MKRGLALAVLGSLAVTAAVSANAGPPSVPKGQKRIDPLVRFEGVEQYPDYIFHVRCGAVYLGTRWFPVQDAKPFALKFDSFKQSAPTLYMTLLAMKREDFNKRAKDNPKLDWLTENTPGVLSAKLDAPSVTIPVEQKDVPLTTYRVKLKDDKLSAEKVEDPKTGEGPPLGLVPAWTFGLVSSLSIGWLGIWFARRGAAKPRD
jgi:hypothetical protein